MRRVMAILLQEKNFGPNVIYYVFVKQYDSNIVGQKVISLGIYRLSFSRLFFLLRRRNDDAATATLCNRVVKVYSVAGVVTSWLKDK